MACDCINKKEKRVQEELSKVNKEFANKVITHTAFENTAFMTTGKSAFIEELYTPMKIEYDTVNKKGETVHKKEKINMTFKYCPFCGCQYE